MASHRVGSRLLRRSRRRRQGDFTGAPHAGIRAGADRGAEDTPILQGTTAALGSVGFTGATQVQLDGGVRGAPAIAQAGPYGVPVIPTRPGGFAAILNTAPELLNRVSTLTERVTELLSDRNQDSISDILANTERASSALADRAPEIAATLAEARIAIRQAGDAATQFGRVAGLPIGCSIRKARQSCATCAPPSSLPSARSTRSTPRSARHGRACPR
jgi:phospholipid/cholesterol/gamma-HCH transport system substrate-binding protein